MEAVVFKAITTKDGRLFGVYIGIRGRENVFIASNRRFLYRINYPYMCDGRFYSTYFCLRRSVGKVEVYNAMFQKEERIGLQFKSFPWFRGRYRFCGSIDFSFRGLVCIQIDALNSQIYPRRKRSDSEADESTVQQHTRNETHSISGDYYDN